MDLRSSIPDSEARLVHGVSFGFTFVPKGEGMTASVAVAVGSWEPPMLSLPYGLTGGLP